MTILEAEVEEKNWQLLQGTYKDMTSKMPSIIKATYLAQDQSNKSIWRIVTFWESQEALDSMRASGKTPTGVLIFQSAQANPILAIYDVHQSSSQ
jgi:hypothetical protein